MRVIWTVTDEDIRNSVEKALADLEEDKQVFCPEEESREEFIEDVAESIIDRIRMVDEPIGLLKREITYGEVWDTARLYGWTT